MIRMVPPRRDADAGAPFPWVVVESDPEPDEVLVVSDPGEVVVPSGLPVKSPPLQPKWNDPGHSCGSVVHP